MIRSACPTARWSIQTMMLRAGSPDLLTRRRALGQRRIEAVGAHLAKVAEAANDA